MTDGAHDTSSFADLPPDALLLDQRRRWQRGEPVRVETCLEQQPDLSADTAVLLDVIYDEFILRERQGKVVAAIGHRPWLLCSTRTLKGKKATCLFAIQDDVINAGGKYVDAEVVRDGNLITSRKPDDLPAFMQPIIQAAKVAKPALAGVVGSTSTPRLANPPGITASPPGCRRCCGRA